MVCTLCLSLGQPQHTLKINPLLDLGSGRFLNFGRESEFLVNRCNEYAQTLTRKLAIAQNP